MRAARERLKSHIASHLHRSPTSNDDNIDVVQPGSTWISNSNDQPDSKDNTCPIATHDLQTCPTCLKGAVNPAKQGPGIDNLRKAAGSGCSRCAVIIRGLDAFKHVYDAEADQDPSKHDVQIHFVSPRVIVSTSGQYLRSSTGRTRYYKRYEFCYNLDKSTTSDSRKLFIC